MSQLKKIIQAISEAGGVAYEVGGCVRDSLLGHPNKDLDIEVFHLDAPKLSKILSRFGRVNEVGVSSVLLNCVLHKVTISISRCRVERAKWAAGIVVFKWKWITR